jgi:hypothetical protein
MDGDMKRETLALACLFICGCAGRMNTDLLQARIREQATQLSESQREIAKTRTELKLSRLEAERLRSEFAQNGQFDDESTRTPIQISKIHIYPLASGGLNKDRDPGDDAIVVQFAPFDEDNEPIKVPGSVDLVLLDPEFHRE